MINMNMRTKLSLFTRNIRLSTALFFVFVVVFSLYTLSEKRIERAHNLRYQSFLLADELRHSSDDLTRMARTYAVTGEANYKNRYQEILDIRDGKKPRPENYQSIYWDLILADATKPPTGSTPAVALLELMRQAGFTETELGKLAEAKAHSDALTATEYKAMQLAETSGAKAEANRAKARLMLHDAAYHQAKAAIMSPINEFYTLMDRRTLHAIQSAESNAMILRLLFIALGWWLAYTLWRTYTTLKTTLGGTIDEVHTQIAKIGGGNFSIPINIPHGLENSVLGWLSETQIKLNELERERKIAEAKIQRINQFYAALSQCNQAIVRCTSEEELFPLICRNVVKFGGMQMAWIGMVDTHRHMVIPCASYGEHTDSLKNIEISIDIEHPCGAGPASQAIRENQPYWCQDFMNDPATQLWREKNQHATWGASASLPIHKKGLVVGVFTLYAQTTHAFDPAVCDLLLEMASDISFALDNFAHEAERKQALQELQISEATLKYNLARTQLLLDSALDAIISMDHNGIIVGWSQQAERIFGYTQEQAIGQTLAELIVPPIYRAAHHQGLRNFVKTGVSNLIGKRVEVTGLRADGSEFPMELTISALKQGDGYIFSSYVRDITERKADENRLRQAAAVFESTREGVVITDTEERITRVNRAFTAITSYTEAEVLGKKPTILKSGRHDAAFYAAMRDAINRNGHWQGEIWNRRKNGEIYPELLSISTVRNALGQITDYVGVFADITQLKASEAQLEFLAHHDPLTSLPNRLLLFAQLTHGITQSQHEDKPLALLMIDLDRFKDVNDSFGHLAGDELLQLVAERLKACLRDVDMVARLGGDEFTVLLQNINAPEDAARVADTIIVDLSRPWHLSNGAEVRISASVGISLLPGPGKTAEDLLQQADSALYQAKAEGRNRFIYFSDDLTSAARSRINLEARLRRAIAGEELRVYYQPQVDITTNRIVGAEALVRWQDPIDGLIFPAHFIQTAEETGLISDIGEWVLRETCRQGQQWLDEGLPPLRLAVNVSPHQFRHGNLDKLVASVLAETAFPANRLELEFTESGLMEYQSQAIQILNDLRAQGIRLAIDDFGTGYSSLAYLKHFPLDVLKIDKSFIDDIPHNKDDMGIAATVVAMGHILGFKVLAEGVETTEQLDFLKTQNCDLYQGYIKSQPLSADDFELLLRLSK